MRFRGDEPELYLAFNHELVKLIERDARAAPEDIEDACSLAWIQFFRYQPPSGTELEGPAVPDRAAGGVASQCPALRRVDHRSGRRIARAWDHEGATTCCGA